MAENAGGGVVLCCEGHYLKSFQTSSLVVVQSLQYPFRASICTLGAVVSLGAANNFGGHKRNLEWQKNSGGAVVPYGQYSRGEGVA